MKSPLAAVVLAVATGAVPAIGGGDPLDPLTADEIRSAAAIVRSAQALGKNALFPLLELHEPDKASLDGDPPRRALVIVRDRRKTFEAVVDLDADRVDSWRELSGAQPRLTGEETSRAVRATRRNREWRAALEARGIEDPRQTATVVFSAGVLGRDDEKGVRLVRVLTYDRRHGPLFWGHPLEGLVVTVDVDRGAVVRVDDEKPLADEPSDSVPSRTRRPSPGVASEPRASIGVDGHVVSWGRWRFHLKLDARTGIVVSRVHWQDGGTWRSVLHQGSLSELFVPYADPGEDWRFRGFLDAGELGLGANAPRLAPGRHCPDDARFVDALLADARGEPRKRPAAICLFERTPGDPLWVHEASSAGARVPRLGRELVVRSIAALGNYDYVFDWVFREEGTIRAAVGATGVALVKRVEQGPVEGGAPEYGRYVAPHTVAVNHDHFMSYRLDLDVDGPVNDFRVDEIRRGTEEGPWTVKTRVAARESEAKLHMSMERPVIWRVANPRVTRAGSSPTSYELRPEHTAMSLYAKGDLLPRRGGFSRHVLWVTPYAADERHAAGAYPAQSIDGGLPTWTAKDRPLGETDVVLWYTLGFHHVVRTEDWPIMPTAWHGFELRPFDFFAENPVLEEPQAESESSESAPPR